MTEPIELVELQGGPLDGQRVASEPGVEWLAFENVEPGRTTVFYRPSGQRTADGTPIFEVMEPPGDVIP